MRVIFACVLCCVFCLGFPYASCASDRTDGVRLLDIRTLVNVLETDAVDVTEKMEVEVLPGIRSHGITRGISVRPRWKDLARRDVRLTVLEALLDGRRISVSDTESASGVCRVHLRDRAKYLVPGRHTFLLKYRLTRQTEFGETSDSITWSVPGLWKGGAGSALCAVLVPEGSGAFTSSGRFSSAGGSSVSVPATSVAVRGRYAYAFRTPSSLKEGESLTVSVSWPSGLVERPAAVNPADACGFTLRLAVFFLIVLAVCSLSGYLLRRGRKSVPPAEPGFPPFLDRSGETVSPVMADYALHGGRLTSSGLAGLLLSLLGQGCLGVEEKDGPVLKKTGRSAEHAEEQAALDAIPASFRADAEARGLMGRTLSAAADVLSARFPRGRGLRLMLGILQCAAASAGIFVLFCLRFGDPRIWMPDVSGALFCGFCLTAYCAAALLFIKTRKGWSRILWIALFAVILCLAGTWIGFGEAGSGAFLRPDSPFWMISPLQSLFVFAAVLAPFACFPCLDARPDRFVELRTGLRGLSGFMEGVQEPTEEQYRRLLPYASVFGLENVWNMAGKEEKGGESAPLQPEEMIRGFCRSLN